MKQRQLWYAGVLLVCSLFYVVLGGQSKTCIDNDGDGFSIEGGGCPPCLPPFDCDDTDVEVNPGVVEGPSGDPICSDGIDNDCDGMADGEDPGCNDDMVLIPAGEFVMGSDPTDPKSYSKVETEHIVYLSAYLIDLYEVTNQAFGGFLNDYGSNTSPEGYEMLDDTSPYRHIFLDGSSWVAEAPYEDHPAVEVSWYGANTFCEYYGKRLPTEAEWEKAARGGCEVGGIPFVCEDPADERTFPWGEGIDCNHANYDARDTFCEGETMPVGSYPLGISPYGLYEMAGNVTEWIKDWWGRDYYEYSPYQDPQGPESGVFRVIRGGSWDNSGDDARCSIRNSLNPSNPNHTLGFRCVR